MHHHLPRYPKSHIAAFTGVVLLHGGLMALQFLPQPAVALPQQQVVRVSMVAPSRPPEPQAVQQAEPAPVAPPAKKGMKKAEPPQPEKIVSEPQPAPMRETSGQQMPQATERFSAITEPVAANYLRNPPPVYPRNALRKRQQGTVMVNVRVSMQGLPLHVRLDRSSGFSALDDAALEAVRKWRFVPARRGTEVVEANVVVPVEFRIN